jgi:hypothetical protein
LQTLLWISVLHPQGICSLSRCEPLFACLTHWLMLNTSNIIVFPTLLKCEIGIDRRFIYVKNFSSIFSKFLNFFLQIIAPPVYNIWSIDQNLRSGTAFFPLKFNIFQNAP